jgi:transposase
MSLSTRDTVRQKDEKLAEVECCSSQHVSAVIRMGKMRNAQKSLVGQEEEQI